jgi:hypothetical protein
LAAAGEKDAAAAVKAMKKPSRGAWAVNQLARSHPADIDALVEAGAALRKAQDAALRGDASMLKPAGRDLSDAIDALLAAAGDSTPAVRDAVANSLRAAAVDANPDAQLVLRRGVLVTDLEPAGFGLEGLELPPEIERKVSEPAGPDPYLMAEADRAEARANRLLEAAAAAETRAREARLAADQAVADAEVARAAADASAGGVSRRSTRPAGRPSDDG